MVDHASRDPSATILQSGHHGDHGDMVAGGTNA
jgi:hypothetical protein